MAPGCIVIKLGGSLITREVRRRPVVERERVLALASEIAGLARPVVLVHGTGAFGKPPAIEHGYLGGRLGEGEGEAWIVSQVTAALGALEREILSCLSEQGLPAFRLPAVAVASGVDGRIRLRGA